MRGMARCSSLKWRGPSCSCQRMPGFHLPPITASVNSTGQLKCVSTVTCGWVDWIGDAVFRSRMRIMAIDRFKPGVTIEIVRPYLPEEVANVWRLWKAGIVRENYARADEYGVVIVFEADSVETVKRYTDDFPLTRAGLIEWELVALQVPLPLEALFDAK